MESKPKFYINPLTGRMIKSTAKTYQQLKRDKYVIPKHKCLYNIKSAERCFNRLLKLYPNIVYPSSSFIDIPKTYKNGSVRAFIKDHNNKIIGYIDKHGNKYKLRKPLTKQKAVPIVKEIGTPKVLSKVIEKLPEITEEEQKKVENQFYYEKPIKSPQDINIIHNPLQNDFIPINQKLLDEEIADILSLVNRELIPQKLPPITISNNIAGLIQDDNKIYGIIDTSNKISSLDTPIVIKNEENSDDAKSETSSIPESLIKSESQSETESLPELKIEQDTKDQKNTISLETQIQKQIENLPKVHFLKDEDISSMEKILTESPIIESKEIIEKIKCLDGSQWDVIENRCISCDQYGLVWDQEYKSCKIMLKNDINKMQLESEVKDNYNTVKLTIVEDNKGSILGYLE